MRGQAGRRSIGSRTFAAGEHRALRFSSHTRSCKAAEASRYGGSPAAAVGRPFCKKADSCQLSSLRTTCRRPPDTRRSRPRPGSVHACPGYAACSARPVRREIELQAERQRALEFAATQIHRMMAWMPIRRAARCRCAATPYARDQASNPTHSSETPDHSGNSMAGIDHATTSSRREFPGDSGRRHPCHQ